MTQYFSSVTTLVILLVSSSAETNITENNSGSEEKKNRHSNVKLEVKIHQRHFGEGFWYQRLKKRTMGKGRG